MILCFHNISEHPKNEWELKPSQMLSLKPQKGDEWHFDDARIGLYTHGFEIMKDLAKQIKITIFVVPEWINGNIQEHEKYSNFMTWEQLIEMKEAGFNIGSHGLTHTDLTTLDLNQIEEELKQSKEILQTKLNTEVKEISYPYGKYNDNVISITRKYYKKGYGLYPPEKKSLFNIERKLAVNPDFS